MPSEIESHEYYLINSLKELNQSKKDKLDIRVGGVVSTLQSWHYINEDPIDCPPDTSGSENERTEYIDFEDIEKKVCSFDFNAFMRS